MCIRDSLNLGIPLVLVFIVLGIAAVIGRRNLRGEEENKERKKGIEKG